MARTEKGIDFDKITKAEALEILVGLDVARWGEGEREASARINGRVSRGLLINSIVYHHNHDYGDAFSVAEKKLAKKQQTPEDDAELQKGG